MLCILSSLRFETGGFKNGMSYKIKYITYFHNMVVMCAAFKANWHDTGEDIGQTINYDAIPNIKVEVNQYQIFGKIIICKIGIT